MFRYVRPGPADNDGMVGAAKQPARPVQDRGARARRTDIDGTDERRHQRPLP
jgi:hypothetical protein